MASEKVTLLQTERAMGQENIWGSCLIIYMVMCLRSQNTDLLDAHFVKNKIVSMCGWQVATKQVKATVVNRKTNETGKHTTSRLEAKINIKKGEKTTGKKKGVRGEKVGWEGKGKRRRKKSVGGSKSGL